MLSSAFSRYYSLEVKVRFGTQLLIFIDRGVKSLPFFLYLALTKFILFSPKGK